ncbi:MAG TPA: dienelactone hydrolase family protein, partial [Gemmatimonadales bacterium]
MAAPVALLATLSAAGHAQGRERLAVTFLSNGLTLTGCVVKPAGPGPFPAIIWNHGSEQNPPCGRRFVADVYVRQGYAVFFPIRHGHANSPGAYIGDLQRRAVQDFPKREDWNREMIRLHELYNHDVVAAVNWFKQQPYVDSTRMAMSGLSYGGIQTLLSAEQGLGLKAFVAFAPGAMSWDGNPALQLRLLKAVRAAPAPIFLLQARNDFSLGPSDLLGPAVREKGAPNEAKVYPEHGKTP